MADVALNIGFANSTDDQYNCLLLEQEPWGEDVGETSELQGIQAISAAINGTAWPEVNCGGLNAEFNAIIYAYPCSSGMSYNFKVSHGSVSTRAIDIVYREEIVQCSMKLSHTLDYPVQSMGATSWIGHCYNASGNITQAPAVSIDGRNVLFSEEVYGSFRVRYVVIRHIYYVTVSERTNAIENTYQSVVYAVWDGGVNWLDIEAPANFETYAGDCGNGAFYDDGDGDGLQDGYEDGQLSQTSVCSDKYVNVPSVVEADRKITVDYCSQEVIEDTTTERVEDEQSIYTGNCPDD